jgi:hypothetical protein
LTEESPAITVEVLGPHAVLALGQLVTGESPLFILAKRLLESGFPAHVRLVAPDGGTVGAGTIGATAGNGSDL